MDAMVINRMMILKNIMSHQNLLIRSKSECRFSYEGFIIAALFATPTVAGTKPMYMFIKFFAQSALCCAALLFATSASAATIEIHVFGVMSGKGKVNVAVCDKDHYLKDCVYNGTAVAAAEETVITIDNVPEGDWAILAYQDENQNDKLDRNLLGIPSENYAFSRNAMGKFGPPNFADAAIEIKEKHTVVSVKMR